MLATNRIDNICLSTLPPSQHFEEESRYIQYDEHYQNCLKMLVHHNQYTIITHNTQQNDEHVTQQAQMNSIYPYGVTLSPIKIVLQSFNRYKSFEGVVINKRKETGNSESKYHSPSGLELAAESIQRTYPAGIQRRKDVILTPMRCDDVASTSIRRHFDVACQLGRQLTQSAYTFTLVVTEYLLVRHIIRRISLWCPHCQQLRYAVRFIIAETLTLDERFNATRSQLSFPRVRLRFV